MIKLFRNIRRKLAAQNKVASYLRYAIGEILLVVIGILIALQVNNWNEERKNATTEKQYISSLKDDIKTDSINLSNTIKQNKSRIDYLDSLATLSFAYSKNEANVSSMYKMYFRSLAHPDFVSQSDRTLVQLRNTGNMHLIKNQEILDAIANYEDYFKKLSDQQTTYSSVLGKMADDGRNIFNHYYFLKKVKEFKSEDIDSTLTGNLSLLPGSKDKIVQFGNDVVTFQFVAMYYVDLLKDGQKNASYFLQILKDYD